jgi:hypothetical protein
MQALYVSQVRKKREDRKMRSELQEMHQRHRGEEEELRKHCLHNPGHIKIRYDRSCVGAGSAYPSVHVVCRNCGCKKIMFREDAELKVKIVKTLRRQKGIKDQRLDCVATYDWELT